MTKEQIEAAYLKIWEANLGQLDSVTVIVGKSSESESAQGQVIVSRQDYLETMAAMEARLQELETAAAGEGPLAPSEHVNFGSRFTRT